MPELYSQINLYVGGILLAENVSIETAIEGDEQDVFTIVKGWAGITPGSHLRSVTANNVVPRSGVEFDFEKAKLESTKLDLKLVDIGSGTVCNTTGYITAVSRSAGVNQTTTLNFSFRGTKGKFE